MKNEEYSRKLDEQHDAMLKDVSSRILRDVNRKTRAIILIPGTAQITLRSPKVSVAGSDDLLRVAVALQHSGLVVVQAIGPELTLVDHFAQLIGARIYRLADLPGLESTPADQMLSNKYDVLPYPELETVLAHVEAFQERQSNSLVFDENLGAQHGAA